jgi:aminoglycoside phosphotransferase (APT) family kinase protein
VTSREPQPSGARGEERPDLTPHPQEGCAELPDDGPFPELTPEQIDAIMARHGLDVSPQEISPLPSIGTVNTVLALGPHYVLRVPKATSVGVGDTLTESVAAPVARAAGIRTPALLVFDDSRALLDVPYTIYERVPGENFGAGNTDPDASADVYREIGRELARLHQRVRHCPDPHGYLDEPARLEPAEILDRLATEALVSAANVRWLNRVFDRLRPAVTGARGFRRFLHNDALPTNVIVKDGAYLALIDWNDSGWGDPALEFWAMPSRAISFALAGYREIAPLDGDETAEQRILWDHLCLALDFLQREPHPGNLSWGRPPFARLIELLAATAEVEPWRQLLT